MNDIEKISKVFQHWGNAIVNYFPKIFLALIVILLFYFFAKSIRKYTLNFYTKVFKKYTQVAALLASVIYAFFLLSGFFLALEILGLESILTKLLAGAGIVGIIAGFAFKDIASNAFAGFLIKLLHPFKFGDWVGVHEEFGTIQYIGLVTTSIKNVFGQEIFVPNQLIYSNIFKNYSSYHKRRVVLSSGVSYGDDLKFVKKVALEEVQQIDGLLDKDVIDFYFTEIGPSSYKFDLRFWIKFEHQKDFLNARSEIIMRIKERFNKEGITITYTVVSLDFGVSGGTNLHDKAIQIKQ